MYKIDNKVTLSSGQGPNDAGFPLGIYVKSQATVNTQGVTAPGSPDVASDVLVSRYRLLARSKRILRGAEGVGSGVLGCQTVPYCVGGYVDVVRAVDEVAGRGRPVSYRRVKSCNSIWVCPVCSARIASGRSAEVRQAIRWAMQLGLDAYMMTLTYRHNRGDDLGVLLSQMSAASVSFWGGRSVKAVWRSAGMVGRITATEVTYSDAAGWHPHIHVLLIGRRGLSCDDLHAAWSPLWLAALSRAGLSGVADVACHVQGARAVENYLIKMSSEMTLGNVSKCGRVEGHYSPFQLLAMSEYRLDYKSLWRAYYGVTKGKRSLVWSRGLKGMVGVADVPDDEVAEVAGETEVVIVVNSRDWRRLTHYELGLMRSVGAYSITEMVDILDSAGVRYSLVAESIQGKPVKS